MSALTVLILVVCGALFFSRRNMARDCVVRLPVATGGQSWVLNIRDMHAELMSDRTKTLKRLAYYDLRRRGTNAWEMAHDPTSPVDVRARWGFPVSDLGGRDLAVIVPPPRVGTDDAPYRGAAEREIPGIIEVMPNGRSREWRPCAPDMTQALEQAYLRYNG